MNVGELLQAAQAAWSNALSVGAILTTILSGYLVVAYVAGRDMTRSQLVIVNSLYVLMFSISLMASLSFVMRAAELVQLAIELSDHRLFRPLPEVAVVLGVVWLFALVASLKFMWDVRHKPKKGTAKLTEIT